MCGARSVWSCWTEFWNVWRSGRSLWSWFRATTTRHTYIISISESLYDGFECRWLWAGPCMHWSRWCTPSPGSKSCSSRSPRCAWGRSGCPTAETPRSWRRRSRRPHTVTTVSLCMYACMYVCMDKSVCMCYGDSALVSASGHISQGMNAYVLTYIHTYIPYHT